MDVKKSPDSGHNFGYKAASNKSKGTKAFSSEGDVKGSGLSYTSSWPGAIDTHHSGGTPPATPSSVLHRISNASSGPDEIAGASGTSSRAGTSGATIPPQPPSPIPWAQQRSNNASTAMSAQQRSKEVEGESHADPLMQRHSGGRESEPVPTRSGSRSSGGAGGRTDRVSDAQSGSSSGEPREPLPQVAAEVRDVLSSFRQAFVISDATLKDTPIMFASEEFYRMTGYGPSEVIGKNCRFLQGKDTKKEDVDKIRQCVKKGEHFCGRILNYRKNGEPFWNLLTVAPVKNSRGECVKFIGMQVEVSKYTEGSAAEQTRPGGLPTSLLSYDARAKERLVPAVEDIMSAVTAPPAKNPLLALDRLPPSRGAGAGGLSSLLNLPTGTSGGGPGAGKHGFVSSLPLVNDLLSPNLGIGNHKAAPLFLGPVPPRSTPSPVNGGGKARESRGRESGEEKRHSSGVFAKFGLRRSKDMGSPSGSGRNLAGQGPAAHIPEDGEVERQPAPDAKTPDLRDSTDSSGMELGECRIKEMRRGIDIATTLERIQKNFVITDPRLPDNPIIFASDSFLELTEYTREEIIGRNCRFLQGEGTDRATVQRIRDAIRTEKDVTVQLLNYTKSGKPFWNLFHLQAVKDQQGLLQYFIGVQLDGSLYLDKNKKLSEDTASKGTVLIRETASKVDTAVKELPDAALKKEDLWAGHQVLVLPKPHKCNSSSWEAVRRVAGVDTRLRLKHFRPVKPLGAGDTGNVHLVELRDTGKLFAMKAMDKNSMIARNKVHRTNMEREILGSLDHPFLPTLYSSFTTKTHVCLITDYCSGGELFTLMDRQPEKRFSEASARFYCAEVLLALEYLHLKGVIYRDLKPENVLLMDTGHIQLTDFDLSFLTRSSSTVFKKTVPAPRSSPVVMSRKARMRRKRSLRKSKARGEEGELSSSMSVMVSELVVEPAGTSNSFVGTEEYIAPEVITGSGHTGTIDWWAFGVLLYELLCGKTPFRGRNRQRTFRNILEKPVIMPPNIEISSEGQDLIQKLLIRDPLRRLGSQRGANEIKEHPFFRAINFPLIRTMASHRQFLVHRVSEGLAREAQLQVLPRIQRKAPLRGAGGGPREAHDRLQHFGRQREQPGALGPLPGLFGHWT